MLLKFFSALLPDYVQEITKKMGRQGFSISTHPFYFHYWRQPYRFCGKKNYECSEHRVGLALGGYLYTAGHPHLADDGSCGKYSIWPVPFFYRVYP